MNAGAAAPDDPPRRVALDVTPVFAAVTGIARHAGALWRALEARPDVDVRPIAVGWRVHADERVHHVRVPMRLAHGAWRWTGRPRAEQLVGTIDVVHGTDVTAPPSAAPRIVTVHDLLPLTRPELFPQSARRAARRAATAVRRRGDLVLTTCEATAADIVEATGIDPTRVVVTRPGRTQLPSPADGPPIAGPYVLAVGAVTPRKGYDVLAEAAAALGPDCPPIVVAGGDWWQADAVRARVAELDRHGALRFLGPVSDGELATLYRHATLLCHPSRAEGFGFPCLEAMDAGLPVVASDLPSLRELGADTLSLVPVDDADALAAAVDALLRDDDERARRRAAGVHRAATYSWEATADAVVDVYRRATTTAPGTRS